MKYGARDALAPDWYEAGLSTSERKQRGHFSTPHALVDQILDACGYSASADLSRLLVLDPACGSGNFLAQAAQRLCLALAWQSRVDLLLVNPPYLATRNTDLSQYRQARQRRQVDSYLLFLELALRAVRPGGWIGLVLPDPVLARANAAPERASLLRSCTIQHIWHLSGVFAAEVGAVVIVAQKTPPHALHRVCWTRERWCAGSTLYRPEQTIQRVGQALLLSQPGTELRYLLSHEQGRTSERLRQALQDASTRPAGSVHLLPLEALVHIKRGEEIGRASALLKPLARLDDGLPVLRGGVDLRPYTTSSSDLGIERATLKKPLERYLRPKLLVVKSTARLQAALDTHGHVVLQTLYLLQARTPKSRGAGDGSPVTGFGVTPTDPWGEGEGRGAGDGSPVTGFGVTPTDPWGEGEGEDEIMDLLYFLLALLNSRLLGAYVYHLHTAYKLVQPQIEQVVLARLPVAWGSASKRREIAERARALARACSEASPGVEWDEQVTALYEEQERAIGALYRAATSEVFASRGVREYD